MLMKQQDRIDDRVKDIEEQLYKLESDKVLVEVKTNAYITTCTHASVLLCLSPSTAANEYGRGWFCLYVDLFSLSAVLCLCSRKMY